MMADVTCPNCGGTLHLDVPNGDPSWSFEPADFPGATPGGWALMSPKQTPSGPNLAKVPTPSVALPNYGGHVVCHVPPCPGSVGAP